MPTSKEFLAGLSLVGVVLCVSCDQGGGASTAPPPPPLPLSWNDVPDEITVKVGEEETFTATLSAAVSATYSISASGAAASVSGEELRAGVYRGKVIGVEAGEVQVTLRANHTGYATATDTVDVVVEDLFDENLWRELVFDAYDCPNGSTDEWCMTIWGERSVEQRITAVFPVPPNFHLVGSGDWKFSSFQESTVRDAIRVAYKQITGEPFPGRITSGNYLKDQYGWIDVAAARAEFFNNPNTCGAAWTGSPNGFAVINLDTLDFCDLYAVTMHEVGHTLGFFHVLNVGDYIMSPYLTDIPPVFSEGEQFHTQLAWELGRGMPYTPDPRNVSSARRVTMDIFSPGGAKTLDKLHPGEMVVCPAH